MHRSPYDPPQKLSLPAKWIVGLSCTNLAILCLISYFVYSVSETWWVGTVLTYAPRLPFLFPTLALLLSSLFWHRGSLGINLVSVAIALVPISGLCVPSNLLQRGSVKINRQSSMRIVSCNVQEFKPNFSKVLEEIAFLNPDVVALQESLLRDPRLEQHFHDWYVVHQGNFWVGSRYPVSLVKECTVTQFDKRLAGIVVEIQAPTGAIVLADVHQMTVRYGLTELNRMTPINGDGTKELDAFENERFLESLELRAMIELARQDRPMIVCGDFNMPVTSNLFQKHWGDLQSSFDIAGFGFGYTSPCKGNRFWPNNLPWARIDHILCSKEWTIHRCQIGQSDGSDHRLIAATIEFKQSTNDVAVHTSNSIEVRPSAADDSNVLTFGR